MIVFSLTFAFQPLLRSVSQGQVVGKGAKRQFSRESDPAPAKTPTSMSVSRSLSLSTNTGPRQGSERYRGSRRAVPN